MWVWFEIYIAVITRANKEDASLWFEINYPGGEEAEPSPINQGNLVSWVKPPTGYLKCNIGVSWVSRHDNCGAAWILCDGRGKTILHSRRGRLC